MKTVLSFMLLFGFFSAQTVSAQAPSWKIDNYHSNIAFTINHYFTPIPGTFHDFTGTIHFDPETPETGEIDIVVQVASVDTNVERRDDHLRTADFFEVETYPEMHFRSTDIRGHGDNQFTAHGLLTIKDITKEIELPFELLGVTQDVRNPENTIAGLQGTLNLNRLDFGVGVGNFASTAVIGSDVNINIFLEVILED